MHISMHIIVFLQRVIGHRKTESFVIVPPLHATIDVYPQVGGYDTLITVVIMSSDMSADSVPVTELIPKGHIYIRSHRKSESEYCNCASCS